MPSYHHVKSATRIPVPGNKLIEEYFGHVNSMTSRFSLAHMIAPPGWSEPGQKPEFGEVTLMIKGTMRVEVGPDVVDLKAGEALWTEPGLRVRYSNPFPEPNEYYAFCLPAFSPTTVHREPTD